MPVGKTVGDKAIGATINQKGLIKFKTEKIKKDTLLYQIIHIIKETYTAFGRDNLRILMQTFYDWRIFWNHLDDRIKSKNDLIQELIQDFFPLSFEIKAGFNPEELRNLKKDFIENFHEQRNKTGSNKKNIYTILGKYNVSFLDSIISAENWEYFFINGIPNEKEINNELLQSKYFYDENTPAWKKLFHYRSLSDEEFLNEFSIIENEINFNINII
jgi:hypothetical protein